MFGFDSQLVVDDYEYQEMLEELAHRQRTFGNACAVRDDYREVVCTLMNGNKYSNFVGLIRKGMGSVILEVVDDLLRMRTYKFEGEKVLVDKQAVDIEELLKNILLGIFGVYTLKTYRKACAINDDEEKKILQTLKKCDVLNVNTFKLSSVGVVAFLKPKELFVNLLTTHQQVLCLLNKYDIQQTVEIYSDSHVRLSNILTPSKQQVLYDLKIVGDWV